MKNRVGIFCLLFVSLTAHSKALTAKVSGDAVLLLNSSGQPRALQTDGVTVEVLDASALTSPLRRLRKEKELTIKDSQNSFTFRIPKESQNDPVSVVHQAKSGQSAHLSLAYNRSQITSTEVEKVVACTLVVSKPLLATAPQVPGGVLNSIQFQAQHQPGQQKAIVRQDTWIETIRIAIYTEDRFMKMETEVQEKTSERIIAPLSDCR